jgi:DNA modification methylase
VTIASRIVGHGEEAPDQLLANPLNFRRHPGHQLDALRGSMGELGWVKSVIVNRRTGYVLDGHARVEEAIRQRIKTIPVEYVDLTPEEERIALAVLDPITEIAIRDQDALNTLLADVQAKDPQLQAFLESLGKEPEVTILPDADLDAVPEPPKDPITKPGDVIELGEHRLMCGDSTVITHVETLMAGKKAVLMNTDPPYGVSYVENAKSKGQATGFGDIENDELDGEKLQQFLEEAIRSAIPFLSDTCAFYLWHPMLTQGTFFAAAAAAAADILIHRQIIWVKPSMVFGRGDYHWRHELCFYGWRRGHRPPFYGERNQTTIWEAGRENDKIHPTQKPVALFEPPILNHTKRREVVYEPFAGSGSQFMAAEKHGRRCFGMELSPAYCDVIVRRWEEATGKTSTRPPSTP